MTAIWLGAGLVAVALGLGFGAFALMGSETAWVHALGLGFGVFAYTFSFAFLVGGCALMLGGLGAMGLRRYRKGRGHV